mgnify:CR=1 FL=1
MEGKDVIIEKILSDARQEADKIVAEANDYATATLDKARAQAKDKVSVAEKAAETAGVEYVGRRITVAGLDLKKAKLNAKIALLDDVYDKAADAVRNVPDKDYKNLIEGMLDSAAEDGDVVGQQAIEFVGRMLRIGQRRRYVEMRHGIGGVHARVGTARAGHLDRLAQQRRKRPLERRQSSDESIFRFLFEKTRHKPFVK